MPRDALFVAPLQHFAPGIDREETPIIEREDPTTLTGWYVAHRRVTLGLATEPADRTPILVALPRDHLTPASLPVTNDPSGACEHGLAPCTGTARARNGVAWDSE